MNRLIIPIVLLSITFAYAQDIQSMAILDFKGEGVTEHEANSLTNGLRIYGNWYVVYLRSSGQAHPAGRARPVSIQPCTHHDIFSNGMAVSVPWALQSAEDLKHYRHVKF